MSTTFHELKDPPTVHYNDMKPVYDEHNDCMWIQIKSDMTHTIMWQYDMNKQQMISKYNCPQAIDIDGIYMDPVFDQKNRIIYMFTESMISFNINTRQWKYLVFTKRILYRWSKLYIYSITNRRNSFAFI
eukprot:129943_1